MRIAVYGASGFTGGLAVAEVHRRGFVPVLVGRDPARLRAAALAAGVPDAEVRVAGLDDIDALTAAFDDCAAVVNCAGPFTLWGEPVVRAAIAASCHYVDTTGEQRYIRTILDTFDEPAAQAGVTLVPAMADDGGPGDLIAAVTAARVNAPLEDMLIADLRLPGAASRGTARSMAAIFADGPLHYTDGDWHESDGEHPAPVIPPGEDSAVPVYGFALPGVITIPRHVRTRRVRSAVRSVVGDLFQALTPDVVESIPEVLTESERRASRWLMLAEAVGADGSRARGWVSGPDGYGLTAVIAVEAARRLASGAAKPGALTPAQAFDPTDFLNYLTTREVSWAVEQN
ncbi:saccharopine dehydrogenase NADP-binding domain-containing protein [Nocardia sp. NPDC051030]|uniref:saccharopine dehydrogenase family protein n=1 Tax=Nocardia sp. NPDC051030 TaxID=3155162 RepID=UPI00341FFAEE